METYDKVLKMYTFPSRRYLEGARLIFFSLSMFNTAVVAIHSRRPQSTTNIILPLNIMLCNSKKTSPLPYMCVYKYRHILPTIFSMRYDV